MQILSPEGAGTQDDSVRRCIPRMAAVMKVGGFAPAMLYFQKVIHGMGA